MLWSDVWCSTPRSFVDGVVDCDKGCLALPLVTIAWGAEEMINTLMLCGKHGTLNFLVGMYRFLERRVGTEGRAVQGWSLTLLMRYWDTGGHGGWLAATSRRVDPCSRL